MSMKKLLSVVLAATFLFAAQAAMVKIYLHPEPFMVDGAPATHIKIRYGSHLNVYTNEVVFSLNVPVITNETGFQSFDPFQCTNGVVWNRRILEIKNLQYTQQFYYAYSYIGSNGVETPIIQESSCGFTVTNRTDELSPPKNLTISK